MIAAPFFHVGFADFWLADQLNSLTVALLDFYYMFCFYANNENLSEPIRKFSTIFNKRLLFSRNVLFKKRDHHFLLHHRTMG